LLVAAILLATPTQARVLDSDYSTYVQSLVDHHRALLPNNIERNQNIRCLALNIYYESRGEPILGQVAVANVTMNRAEHHNQSICQVVYSPGQFHWTANRGIRGPGGDAWRQALTISWLLISQPELIYDVTNGARFFHGHRRTPSIFRSYEHIATIGGHRFYRTIQFVEVAQAPD
jgi:spore germination cell wall hydrolase CwlJ-like protein